MAGLIFAILSRRKVTLSRPVFKQPLV